ncbi:hypothetical protein CCR94_01815 [Rhodoblastus sphagnicola]|uniref:TonB C-terminal domain-containing protein n=1 Tax=Rhodoblastus sphagnicola TaxID=333368 RepID=A0A2S6NFR8_9HYPH|nr:energy transducer TonB [Rhodoblastus sphagnicola]MBB4200913.1 protein TonB [Rhodoblastus sphagnicola]PPQ33440.1 hypothetical protein CCR94_01815 [Rhodoblastus sphagnicola]
MVLSSALATPFLPESASERLGAGVRRTWGWSLAASLSLHLAVGIMFARNASEKVAASDVAGGTQVLEIAYLSSDEANSVESEAAPQQTVADEPLPPEISAAPPVSSAPALAKEDAPTVAKTIRPVRPRHEPAARREAEEKPKPAVRVARDWRPVQRSERAGRGSERQQSRAAAQGGASGPAPAASGADKQNWRGAVLAQLARHKQYPSAARDRDVTGTAIVAFTLSTSGAVVGVSLARGSGSGALDQATLAMVRAAAPFPPAPAGARLSFTTAVNYTLR